MNTPAHLLIGAAAFGRPATRPVLLAALAGALLPDLSLYVMAGWALHIQGVPPQVVFDELYFSPAWQFVFAIDNSIPLWTAGLLLAFWVPSQTGIAFAAAGLLHLATDFLLHAGDGRSHFWPLSRWVYDSPVSYWDSQHHAGWIAPLSAMVCVLAFVVLWRRDIRPLARVGFGALVVAEIWVARQWLLFF